MRGSRDGGHERVHREDADRPAPRIVRDGSVRAELGPVQVGEGTVEIAGYRLTKVSVGNPHAVAFVPDCSAVPMAASGPPSSNPTPPFREGSTAAFATVTGKDRISLRVWERGVGETPGVWHWRRRGRRCWPRPGSHR